MNPSRFQDCWDFSRKTGKSAWRLLPSTLRKSVWDVWSRIQPYQRIAYRNKTLAWGKDRAAAYRFLFPEPPKGKTILDIGCHTGFYCFQASSEGAEFCLGIDIDRKRISKGRRLAVKEGIPNIQLIAADIRLYEIEKSFDILICLNVLQHMKDIESVDGLLDKLNKLVTERLMLIVPMTKKREISYEHELRGKVPYLLLSERYFYLKYRGNARVLPLPADCYGPGRALVIVDHTKQISV